MLPAFIRCIPDSGDGGLATNASLYNPLGIALDNAGNIFFAGQDQRIRKVGTNGIITTVAGNGSGTFAGDGGAATNASLNNPYGVKADYAGNLYIADSYNQRIRKVGTNGIITTVAGNGSPTFAGDGGLATNAAVPYPFAVTLDSAGNLLFTDEYGHIRKVNANGIITTVAGNGSYGYSGDGGLATSASLYFPYGVAVDNAGNLLIADSYNHRIRKVSPSYQPMQLWLPYVSTNNLGNYSVIITSPAGTFTSGLAALNMPAYITQQPQSQNVWAGSTTTFGVTAAGMVPFTYQWELNGTNISGATNANYGINPVTIANGGNYTVAVSNAYGGVISAPANLAVDYLAQGLTNMVVTNGGSAILSVGVTGAGPFYYQWQLNGINLTNLPRVLTSASIITTAAGNGSAGYSGDGGWATNAALNLPHNLTVDSWGNLFITDYNKNHVRKVDTNGVITTVAGNGSASYSGDGGWATNAALNEPNGVAVDSAGNLYVADFANHRIRKVGINGIISTLAGNGSGGYSGDGGPATNAALYYPNDVTVDNYGNVFIADTSNQRVRKVGTNGVITTVAGNGSQNYSGDGGVATNASLNTPTCVRFDPFGNLLIADQNNYRIREVGTNGIITTLAGNGNASDSGDGGPATNAGLAVPNGVTVDNVGNVFITDYSGQRIRKVDTNGIITTAAGNGSQGYSGDGGGATNAMLSGPCAVAVDYAGNLFIGDFQNNRIRKVAPGYQPTLVLTNISTNGLGNYAVIITAPAGTFTNSATLSLPLSPRNFAALTGVNGLQLKLVGSPGYVYVLQSATNLAPPVNWVPVFTNPADGNGNWSFMVTNLTGTPGCFYRAFRQ